MQPGILLLFSTFFFIFGQECKGLVGRMGEHKPGSVQTHL